MKYEILLEAVVLLFLIMPTVLADSITYDPSEYDVDLIAGCSYVREINVTNNYDNDMELKISTTIGPDGEGVNIEYSVSSPFTISANSMMCVKMFINTSMLLMPGSYKITTIFSAEGESEPEEQEEKNKGKKTTKGGRSSTPYVPPEPPEKPEKDEPDNTPVPVPSTWYYEPDDEPCFFCQYKWAAIIGMIASLFITLLILLSRRKKKKNDGGKENE